MFGIARVRRLLLYVIAGIISVTWAGAQDKTSQGDSSSSGNKAAITGTISDQKGAGIADAIVTVDNGTGVAQNAKTDGEGLYAVMDLPSGAYTIHIAVGNVKVFQGTALLSAGQVITLGLGGVAAARGTVSGKGALTGTVSDPAGSGIAGATLIIDDGVGATQNATTDGQGLYAMKDLPTGTYSIKFSVASTRIFQARVDLGANQVVTLGVGGALIAQTTELPSPQGTIQASVTSASVAMQTALAAAPPTTQTANNPSLMRAPNAAEVTVSGPSVSGTVTDQTGAVVVGATVKVTNPTGVVVAQSASDEKGNYAIKDLPPGSYTITVVAPGFKAFVADHITVSPGVPLPMDASLEPSGEKTEVTVQGQNASQVETESAQVSGTITRKEVTTLLLNGRNFTQLIALAPGVSNQTGQDEAKVGVTGSVRYSVNGGRVEYNTFEVDGSDVLNAGLNGSQSTLMVYPSLDAIQEVKVLTSNYGAMYGRTASGTVLVTTKSGGANWHGSAYEFVRNEALNARNYFDQTRHAPLYRRNDFGFSIGGPLYIPNVYNTQKNKTFVFLSEEFRIEKSPSDLEPNFNRAVPSLAERQGDFTDVCPPSNGSSLGVVFLRQQYPDCPSYGTTEGLPNAFPDNRIEAPGSSAQLDINALAIVSTNLIPLPNSNIGCNSTIGSCYNAVVSEPTHWREDLFRVDHNFNTKLRLTFRYINDAWNTQVPVPQWGYIQGSLQNSFPTVQNKLDGPGISAVTNLTHTITPTLLNQFTASYVDSHINLTNINGPGGADFQRPAALGQPGGSCTPTASQVAQGVGSAGCMGAIFNNGFGGKVPGIVVGGTNLEYGGNGFAVDPSYMPWEHTNPTYSLRDDISKVIGKHTLQVGAQLILAQRNETNSAIGAASGDLQGLLTFSNLNGGSLNTGNAFANFLALFTGPFNEVQSYTQDSSQLRYYQRYRIGEPYVQDDWRISRRLTLNLGVRFSLFGVYHEKYLNAYNWEPSAYSAALASQLSVNPTTGQLIDGLGGVGNPIPLDLKNLDPRITNGIIQCGVNHVPDGCMTGKVFNPAPRIGFALDPRGDGKTSIRAGYGMFYEHGTPQEANTGSLEASAPLVLSVTQRFPGTYACIGGGTNCPASGGALPGAFPIDVTAIPSQAVWSYAQQWSLSIERQFPGALVSSVAYVGSKGTHLTVERQLNQLKPLAASLNPFGPNEPLIPQSPNGTNILAGDCGGYDAANSTFSLLNGTVVGSKDPAYINLVAACEGENEPVNFQTPTANVNTLRPYPGLASIYSLQNGADSNYHALQATLRRTQGPLTVGVSYSYSHSIDDSSDRSDATFVNSYDLRSNRASSNFDERHLANFSYIYDFPSLSGVFQRWSTGKPGDPTGDSQDQPISDQPSRLLRWLGDGWQLSGITIVQSGTPFSVINGGSSTISVLDNAGVANAIGAGSYPDVVAHPAPAPKDRYNTESFGPLLGNPNLFVAPRGLTFGTAGRNVLNNPRRTNFDMSLLKHFKVKESGQLEFRLEAFNVFNHTQFRIYNPDLQNTGSNTISCYGGPSYSAGYQGPQINGVISGTDCVTGSSFLHPVDAHRPRTLQVAAKYTF